MKVYYNEIEPFCVAWLRNLMAAGEIPDGYIDTRPIQEVQPDDLAPYTQCHFFAGIGGWAYALQLAGWPADRPVWTGSCPCQPFSAAGKGLGRADDRHLWPHWFRLIEQLCPPVVLGEQVSGAVRHGWLDLVQANLESQGYAFGAAVFGAHSVGAPHIRQRLYFVADTDGDQPWRRDRLAGADGAAPNPGRETRIRDGAHLINGGTGCVMGDTAERGSSLGAGGTLHGGETRSPAQRSGDALAFWGRRDYIMCRDGRERPIEPGTFPLAHGIPGRVGRLRAYGNAIVPQAAAAFIEAYLVIE